MKSENPKKNIETLEKDLAWLRILNLTKQSGKEGAKIEDELEKEGKKINIIDILIGGIARFAGGSVVTKDKDFKKIKGLDVKKFW